MLKRGLYSLGICAICLFVISVPLSAEDQAIPQQVLDLQKAARDNIANKDIGQAIGYYEQVAQTFPNTSYALDAQAQIVCLYIQDKKTQEANAALDKLMTQCSDSPAFVDALNAVASGYRKTAADPAKARQLYTIWLEKYKTSPEAFKIQGRIVETYMEENNMEGANAALSILISNYAAQSGLANVVRKVADKFFSTKHYTEAFQLYQTILKNWPDASEEAVRCYRGQAYSLIWMGKITAAQTTVDTLIANYSAHPDIANMVLDVADEFHNTKNYTQAIQLYQTILNNWPNASAEAIRCYRGQAFSLIRLGEIEAAEAMADKLIFDYSTHPDLVEMVQSVADEFRRRNHSTEALRLYRIDLKNRPNTANTMEYQRGQACSLVQAGDFPAAQAAVDKLISDYSAHPDIAGAVRDVAKEFCTKRKAEQALALFNKALAMNPSVAVQLEAQAGIARVHVQQGNDADVQSRMDFIIQNYDAKDAARALFWIGEEYYFKAQNTSSQGNAAQAKTGYEKAIAILQTSLDMTTVVPKRCSAYYMTGLCYRELGDFSKAADAFYVAIEADPGFIYAGSMHWLIADCYEKLKRDGIVDAAEADPTIEWGYQTLFDAYPDSRDVAYAAMRLGEINLARGKPVEACVYFNWFMDYVHAGSGQFPDIYRILARLKECGK